MDKELDCKTRVMLEMLMEMDNLLPEERLERRIEGNFDVGDCVSGSVCRSPLVYWSNLQNGMAVEPSYVSTFFAHSNTLFPFSPRRQSSPSCSTVINTDEALDNKMTATLEMLMSMES